MPIGQFTVAQWRKLTGWLNDGIYPEPLVKRQVLSSEASLFTFSNVKPSHNHLGIRVIGQTSYSAIEDYVYLRFNGDAASGHYWANQLKAYGGMGASTNSPFDNKVYVGTITGGSAPSAYPGFLYAEIMGYSDSTWLKSLLSRSGAIEGLAASFFMLDVISGGWVECSAITQVDIIAFGGNFKAGSVAELYLIP